MFLKNILYGILIASFIHLLLSSSCIEQTTNPDNNNNNEAIISSLKNAEKAFLSADTNQLKAVLTNDAIKFYDGDFINIQNVMTEIGKAFKENRIIISTQNYAEVGIMYDGQEFIVLMARQDDDTWKIIKF